MCPCATSSPRAEGTRGLRRDDGSSLLLVLLLVPVLTALAGVLALSTTAETLTASRHRDSLVVRHAARALAERVAADLRLQADWGAILAGGSTSTFSGAGTTWRADATTVVDLLARGAALQAATDAGRSLGADTPRWRLYAWGPLDRLATPTALPDAAVYLGAWIADDEDDGDGDPTVDTNGLVVVRAEAYGRSGARWGVTARFARGDRGLDDLWRLGVVDAP